MKVFAAAALLFASLLAGCTSSTTGADPEPTEDGDDLALTAVPLLYLNVTIGNETYRFTSADAAGGRGPGNATSSGTTTVSSGNTTSTKGNSTGNATGNATGKSTKSTPGGDAPLDVSVSLEATKLPANQSLSWSIDFGDSGAMASAGNATGNATTSPGNSTAGGNGTGNATGNAAGIANGTKLPGNAKHTYVEPGAYEIRSSLRQGNKTVATLHVALVVGGNGTNSTATGLPSGTEIGPAPVLEGEGSFTAGTVVSCAESGSFDWVIPLTDEATGTPLALTSLVVTLSGGATNLDSDLEVYGPDGELIDSSAGLSNAESVSADGPFPAGTFRVVVKTCAGVAGSFSVHGEGLLVAA